METLAAAADLVCDGDTRFWVISPRRPWVVAGAREAARHSGVGATVQITPGKVIALFAAGAPASRSDGS
jgi:hypothetical protein